MSRKLTWDLMFGWVSKDALWAIRHPVSDDLLPTEARVVWGDPENWAFGAWIEGR